MRQNILGVLQLREYLQSDEIGSVCWFVSSMRMIVFCE
jgi:hypothetical protein